MKLLDISEIIPCDLLYETMEFIWAKSLPHQPTLSFPVFPIVSNICLTKWPLPSTHVEIGSLLLLTLLTLGHTSCFGVHRSPWLRLITVRSKFSPPYFLFFSPVRAAFGGYLLPPVLSYSQVNSSLLRKSLSPIHVFSNSLPPSPFSSLPCFHRKIPSTDFFILSINQLIRPLSPVFAAISPERRAAPVT